MIPLKPLGPIRDGRFLVFVACDVQPPLGDSSPAWPVRLAGTRIYPLGHLSNPVPTDRSSYEAMEYVPADRPVWPTLAKYGDRLLVVFGDAARDLSLLGEPPGYETVTRFAGSDHSPHVTWIKYRAKGCVRHIIREGESHTILTPGRGGWDRAIDVMQLGNLHPAGELAHEVPAEDAAVWLQEWRHFLARHLLGRMEWTIARQALRSLRHAVTPSTTLWQHRDADLHAFEYTARRFQTVTRVSPLSGAYEGLYHLDFNAFYPRIMASYDMPGTNYGYWDGSNSARTPDRELVEELLDDGLLVVSEYRSRSGGTYFAGTVGTRDALHTGTQLRRLAAYRPAPVLTEWAREMLRLRGRAPDIIAPSVKALSVALWGRLTQRSYEWRDVTDSLTDDDIDELIAARDAGASEIDFGDTIRKMTDDGRALQNDAAAWAYSRWHAVGVHVLEYARRLMLEAMEGCDVVYAHTDSVYSTSPIPFAENRPDLGGDLFDYDYLEDVTFKGGTRYVGGKIDAHHGTARPGIRWLWNPATTGQAHWRTRGQ